MRLSEKIRTERIEHFRSQIRSIVAGRRWIVGDGILVSGTRDGQRLIEFGAEAVLVIAGSRGTGDLAEDPRMTTFTLGLAAPNMQESIRQADSALRNMPDEARARVEAFDPDHTAHANGTIWFSGQDIAGRPLLGARPKAWQAYEDKLVAAALWERAGIPEAPFAVVPTTLDALTEAAARLDQGLGTVWVGDNSQGWHGGASHLRWVRTAEEMKEAHGFLAPRAKEARVMPFLDGIPCSIHAFVTASTVSPVRPCEMLVYRQPDSSVLRYSGAATNWIPSSTQAKQMREAVIRVGLRLQSEVDYRGSFSLDGICNQDGFFPTEVNPRLGGALARMSGSIPDLPLRLLHDAMASGVDLDYRVDELTELVATEADAHPVIRGMALLEGASGIEPQTAHLERHDGNWRTTEDAESAQCTISIGASPSGLIAFTKVEPNALERGASAAPIVAETLAFASELWGFDLTPMIPAPDLR